MNINTHEYGTDLLHILIFETALTNVTKKCACSQTILLGWRACDWETTLVYTWPRLVDPWMMMMTRKIMLMMVIMTGMIMGGMVIMTGMIMNHDFKDHTFVYLARASGPLQIGKHDGDGDDDGKDDHLQHDDDDMYDQ